MTEEESWKNFIDIWMKLIEEEKELWEDEKNKKKKIQSRPKNEVRGMKMQLPNYTQLPKGDKSGETLH